MEELYTYIENKAKFGKPLRRKYFHEGLIQLEQELKNDRNKAANLSDLKGEHNAHLCGISYKYISTLIFNVY